MEHAAHFLRRQVDPGFAGVRQYVAMAVAVALHDAVDLTHQSGAGVCGACDVLFFDEATVPDNLPEIIEADEELTIPEQSTKKQKQQKEYHKKKKQGKKQKREKKMQIK